MTTDLSGAFKLPHPTGIVRAIVRVLARVAEILVRAAGGLSTRTIDTEFMSMTGAPQTGDQNSARDGGGDAPAVGSEAASRSSSHTHATLPAGASRAANALVSVNSVTVTRNGRRLLDRVDLDVEAGEIVTLIGPNGAGKTTLVKTILGLLRPDAGTVTRRANLRVGYVPQVFMVEDALPLTVQRFLSLGTGAGRSAVEAVLQDTGVPGVGDQAIQHLSGGETQRVLLARTLLRSPDLLVLDEPARGVDHLGEADLYALIARLRDARGFGIVLVSHDLNIVMAGSDRVLCLNGHVCCSGKPVAVAKHPEYARLFGARAAAALAVYEHNHDHTHDLAGQPLPPSRPAAGAGRSGE